LLNYGSILYDVDGPVATITLNRPEKMNAISRELENDVADALARADADPAVRAVVLTGAGRAFCSGYDMSGEGGLGVPDPEHASIAEYIAGWHRRNSLEIEHLRQIWDLHTPVIAAVHGYCLGGGLWYSLACDITIASEDAVFGQPEVRGTSSTTFLFAALAGWKAANRYALTGDHFDAAEALRLGVVNEVVPRDRLIGRARALAQRIAMVPEPSVRINRAVTMMGLRAAGIDAGLLLNGVLNSLVHSSYGPERGALDAIRRARGLRAMLDARDGKFRPEPFGPKSVPDKTVPKPGAGRPRGE
jgi:enoyl-CoA hydratase/carnithine racemase